jgi:hypothetical protein
MNQMIKLLMFWATIFAFSEEANASGNQFDLKCAGIINTIIGDDEKNEYYHYHFRLDLDRNIYCLSKVGESCGTIRRIISFDDLNITLKSSENRIGNEIIKEHEFFNRSTGAHFSRYTSMYTDRTARLLAVVWDGSCIKIPFSGIPEIQKQF